MKEYEESQSADSAYPTQPLTQNQIEETEPTDYVIANEQILA